MPKIKILFQLINKINFFIKKFNLFYNFYNLIVNNSKKFENIANEKELSTKKTNLNSKFFPSNILSKNKSSTFNQKQRNSLNNILDLKNIRSSNKEFNFIFEIEKDKNSNSNQFNKKEINIPSKEEGKLKLKNPLNLNTRKKSYKEDPESSYAFNKIFDLKLSKNFINFKSYLDLNTSQIIVNDFYEHTEECFKIISLIEKKIPLDSVTIKSSFIIDKSIENKLNTNYKLALFDMNETLIHYSIDNPSSCENKITFNILNSKGESIITTVGINLRPYLYECLKELSKTYILGIFTSTDRVIGEKIIQYIDPNDEYFKIKLFRENCRKIKNPNYECDLKSKIKSNEENCLKLKNISNNNVKINIYNKDKNKITDNINHKLNNLNINKDKKNFIAEEKNKINYMIKNFFVNEDFSLKKYFYIKDLSIFANVSQDKIVIIDNSILSFCFQIDNGIPIFPFYNDKSDCELRVLVNYLNHLSNCKDLRQENKTVLKLEFLYKTIPINDYSSSSSIDYTNGPELYDSENTNLSHKKFKGNNFITNENLNVHKSKSLNTNTEKLPKKNSLKNLRDNYFNSNLNINDSLVSNKFTQLQSNSSISYDSSSSCSNCLNSAYDKNLILNKNKNNIDYNKLNENIFNSPTKILNKTNLDLNFSFGGGSGKKDYFSNRSTFSNKSNVSNRSYIQEKLFVCLDDFHSKYTQLCKNK